MRILVSGCRGMLGNAVQEVFSDHELLLTDKHNLDVRLWNQVLNFVEEKPELILHLAAETDLELCRKNPDTAYLTNTIGTVHMKHLARLLNIPIVYISTASIFDGQAGMYNEYSDPKPLNLYSRSKFYGEEALFDYVKTYIFRTYWLFGGGVGVDKKMIGIFHSQIVAGKKKLYAPDNEFGNPTYTYDLAKAIRYIVEKKAEYGLYNCVNEGVASRYDVARKFVEAIGAKVEVLKAAPGQFDKKYSSPRPRSALLNINKLSRTGFIMRNWHDAIQEYAKKCYRQ